MSRRTSSTRTNKLGPMLLQARTEAAITHYRSRSHSAQPAAAVDLGKATATALDTGKPFPQHRQASILASTVEIRFGLLISKCQDIQPMPMPMTNQGNATLTSHGLCMGLHFPPTTSPSTQSPTKTPSFMVPPFGRAFFLAAQIIHPTVPVVFQLAIPLLLPQRIPQENSCLHLHLSMDKHLPIRQDFLPVCRGLQEGLLEWRSAPRSKISTFLAPEKPIWTFLSPVAPNRISLSTNVTEET
ncbi:hypothetical protein FRB90_002066 [Tulasnella sp. 427]|nr:hypothetical protein FRB90_002066 [Tulasnella sp. 427]